MKTILLILTLALLAAAQSKPQKHALESPEIIALRNEFIQATKGYKVSLEKLLAIDEKNVAKAQDRLAQSQELYAAGMISSEDLKGSERAVSEAQDKVEEVRQRIASADKQIADTLNNTEQIAQEYKKAVAKRTSTRQRPCPNWTLTAYRRQTKRSVTVAYKFVCL